MLAPGKFCTAGPIWIDWRSAAAVWQFAVD